ncbi:MAG TPA: DNA repair protein RadC [Spirochaetales bacterium]|nr:DNA repair protein RadC [Spirochaetales bacterium]
MSKAYVVFSRVVLVKEKGAMYDVQKKIGSSYDAYKAITEITKVQEEAQEVFGILILNTTHKIVAVHEISRGTLNASMVHPREVFKPAVLHNAAAIICFHNHPSGEPKPSKEDIETTNRLVEAGKIMGIEVLDHIIVGDDKYTSLKEMGVI